jgi:hypothetical protein
MYHLEREFLNTNRNIATNLHVRLPRMVAYLCEKYKDRKIEVLKRLQMLSWAECLFWWRHRGLDNEWRRVIWKPHCQVVWVANSGGIIVPWHEGIEREYPDGIQKEQIEWPTAGDDDPGVCYFLDEWQEHYDQDDYREFTREHGSALNQHRKFKADAWIASPFLSQLAKPYREIGQNFYELRNSGYEISGYGVATVRMPTVFWWNLLRRPRKSDRDKPMCGGHFRLDVRGLASCFDTGAGVGVSGSTADIGIKRSGHHWLWIVAVILVIVVSFKGCSTFGGRAVTWFLRPGRMIGGLSSMSSKAPAPAAPVVAAPARAAGDLPQNHPEVVIPRGMGLERPKPRVFVTWYSRVGDWLTFGLSDGTVLENPDGLWTGKVLMMRDGTVYLYQPQPLSVRSGPSVAVPGRSP